VTPSPDFGTVASPHRRAVRNDERAGIRATAELRTLPVTTWPDVIHALVMRPAGIEQPCSAPVFLLRRRPTLASERSTCGMREQVPVIEFSLVA
jgi:hypothetical protein